MVNVVIGPRQSGKTALLLAILGVVPPRSGLIVVDNLDATLDAIAARRHICFIGTGGPVMSHLTVTEQVRMLVRLGRGQEAETTDLIKAMRLSEIPDDLFQVRCSALTVFERLRLWIAVHRLRGTEILMLDDPTATLAAEDSLTLGRLLRESLNNDVSIVVTSRDPRFGTSLADQIWRIDRDALVGPEDVKALAVLPESEWSPARTR